MKKLFRNSNYKILEVSLNDDESMPLHKDTSDAFVWNAPDILVV